MAHPYSHMTVIGVFGTWDTITTVPGAQGPVITISIFHSRFPSSNVNGKARRKSQVKVT